MRIYLQVQVSLVAVQVRGNRVHVLGLDKRHTFTFHHINRVARFWDILSSGDQLTPEETQSHFWNKLLVKLDTTLKGTILRIIIHPSSHNQSGTFHGLLCNGYAAGYLEDGRAVDPI